MGVPEGLGNQIAHCFGISLITQDVFETPSSTDVKPLSNPKTGALPLLNLLDMKSGCYYTGSPHSCSVSSEPPEYFTCIATVFILPRRPESGQECASSIEFGT